MQYFYISPCEISLGISFPLSEISYDRWGTESPEVGMKCWKKRGFQEKVKEIGRGNNTPLHIMINFAKKYFENFYAHSQK